MLLVFAAAHTGQEVVCSVDSENVCAISREYCNPLVSFFGLNNILRDVFWQRRKERFGAYFNLIILVSIAKLFHEIVKGLQHSLFSILHKKNPTMTGSLRSISSFISSTWYSWSELWLRRLKTSLFIAVCVFLSFKCFVEVYRLCPSIG